MSKSKSIQDFIQDLEAQNERLKSLEKLFNSAVKKEFGSSIDELHMKLAKLSAYERKYNTQKAENATVFEQKTEQETL